MILGLIPARLNSKRLKNKLLLNIREKPLIIHTMQRAMKSKEIDRVYVCTDSKKVFRTVKKYKGNAIMTSSKYKNGTDRIASVVKKFKCKLVVDIQGDEIFINYKIIDKLVDYHKKNMQYDIIVPCVKTRKYKDKSLVKFLFNEKREVLDMTREDVYHSFDKKNLYKQVDIISFLPEKLQKFSNLKRTIVEKRKNIELQRALDNNFKIKTFVVNTRSFSINTHKDFITAKKRYNYFCE